MQTEEGPALALVAAGPCLIAWRSPLTLLISYFTFPPPQVNFHFSFAKVRKLCHARFPELVLFVCILKADNQREAQTNFPTPIPMVIYQGGFTVHFGYVCTRWVYGAWVPITLGLGTHRTPLPCCNSKPTC